MKGEIAIIPIHADGISGSLHGLRWRRQIGIGIFEANGIRLLVREVSHIGHRHADQAGASVRERRRHRILSFQRDGVSKACWAEPGHRKLTHPLMQITAQRYHRWIKHQRQCPSSFRSVVPVRLVGHKPDGIPWLEMHFLAKRADLKMPLQAQEKLFGLHGVGC